MLEWRSKKYKWMIFFFQSDEQRRFGEPFILPFTASAQAEPICTSPPPSQNLHHLHSIWFATWLPSFIIKRTERLGPDLVNIRRDLSPRLAKRLFIFPERVGLTWQLLHIALPFGRCKRSVSMCNKGKSQSLQTKLKRRSCGGEPAPSNTGSHWR